MADPTVVLDLIEAFRRSKTMFVAVSMGVFDRLYQNPAGLSALAREFSANEDALERLLDGCVGLGLLEKRGGAYANTQPADAFLRRSSATTLTGYIRYSDHVLYPMWAKLEDAIRQGTNRWEQVYGGRENLFANFFASDESKREFLSGMHGLGLLSSPAVVRAFDLSEFKRLVDLGGATGHLARAASEAYPQLRVAVFDLPEVVTVAREYLDGSPVELIAGDFFAGELPSADLYALGRILHDWSSEKVGLLLSRIHDALPDGGGLLIAERLLDDQKNGPIPAQMQSLNMLVCTEGKERSSSEYEGLLRAAGFTNVDTRHTGMPVDAVLARK